MQKDFQDSSKNVGDSTRATFEFQNSKWIDPYSKITEPISFLETDQTRRLLIE